MPNDVPPSTSSTSPLLGAGSLATAAQQGPDATVAPAELRRPNFDAVSLRAFPASPRELLGRGFATSATSLAGLAAAGGILMAGGGCASRPNDDTWQTLDAMGTEVAYDADRDRIVDLRLRNRPNMLHTASLDQPPRSGEEYTFYGGHYSWIAPQAAWIDGDGALRNWPPDPAMDRGPMLVTRHTDRFLAVEGPVTRLGFREEKVIEILDQGVVGVEHQLTNETNTMRAGAVWSNTAVPPGAVIAVPKPADGTIIFDRDVETAQPLWEAITEEFGNWILIRTDRKAAEAAAAWGGELKVFIAAAPQIAVGHDGYWLVRRGWPWDDAGSLATVSEAPVEVYLNFGLELFEAELLGPHVTLAPGESTTFSEVWFIFNEHRGDPREIDAAFAALRHMLGMEPAAGESGGEDEREGAAAAGESMSGASSADDAHEPAAPARRGAGERIVPADAADGVGDDLLGGEDAPEIDPSQFIENRP